MKFILLAMALVFSATLSAQEKEPLFVQEGDMVKATYYHDNGNIAQQGYYLDEKLHDQWVMFDEDGKRIAMGQSQMGKRTGKWFFWSQNDLKEVDFEDNKVVNVVKHDNAEAIVVN